MSVVDEKARARIEALEKRVAELEKPRCTCLWCMGRPVNDSPLGDPEE